MSKFRVNLASPPDKERLVAEIFYDQIQIAELNREDEALMMEIYPRPDDTPWIVNLDEFLTEVQKAKARLTGR